MIRTRTSDECPIRVTAGNVTLEGDLCIPREAMGVVVFASGSSSIRHNPRNRYIAQVMRQSGLATLLFDLLTNDEEKVDTQTGRFRFDIRLLANRLVGATSWLKQYPDTQCMNIGYFGTNTGAAAALLAAAEHSGDISAIVSRSGRPDLARQALPYVKSPTLLIVGGRDLPVIAINRDAFTELHSEKKMVVVPEASHLFEEPGALEEVTRLATNWLANYLNRRVSYSSLAPIFSTSSST